MRRVGSMSMVESISRVESMNRVRRRRVGLEV